MRWALSLVVGLMACAREARPVQPVALWFGGDVHLGARGLRALASLQLDAPLVVNLEGPISESSAPSTSQRLLNPLATPALLRAANVVAAGVDNNHALDEGEAGRDRTASALRAGGVTPLGEASVLGVSMLQVDLSAGVPAQLEATLVRARPTVVLFHVLAPPLYLPEPVLQRAVELAVAHGASAVLAHGSHSVGPLERRRDTVIAWGLGNVAFDCDCTEEDEGLLVRLELDGRHVARAEVVPVTAGLHGREARWPDDASLSLDVLESLGSRLHSRTRHRAQW